MPLRLCVNISRVVSWNVEMQSGNEYVGVIAIEMVSEVMGVEKITKGNNLE